MHQGDEGVLVIEGGEAVVVELPEEEALVEEGVVGVGARILILLELVGAHHTDHRGDISYMAFKWPCCISWDTRGNDIE